MKDTSSLFKHLLTVTLLSSSSVLAATSNAVTVANLSGSIQTNRPFTVSRLFAQGEIAACAAPRVDGVPSTNYQTDVKSRWPDGSLQHALISLTATIPTGGSISVDFVNSPSCNNTGYLDTTSKLLNFPGLPSNWDAQIQLTSGATSKVVSLRSMLSSLPLDPTYKIRYWEQGPVKTTVIVEDRSTARSQDVGFDGTTPLHPIFVVQYYTGWSGVKVDYILENPWIGIQQNVAYNLTLTGNGATTYSKSNVNHYAAARWRKSFWIGAVPGKLKVDYNLPYMISTKAIPNFDQSRRVTSVGIQDELVTGEGALQTIDLYNGTDVNSAQFDPGDLGNLPSAMGDVGGHPYIGLFRREQVRYLYTMDPTLLELMIAHAETAGSWPVHHRESDPARYFNGAKTVLAFGRPPSVDARPNDQILSANVYCAPGKNCASPLYPDTAHQPSFAYVPYLISGDWYLLEENFHWAAWTDINVDQNYGNAWYGRGFQLGIISLGNQPRGRAWGLRTLAHAGFVAPDNSPEKAYFQEKVNNTIGGYEGYFNVTSGSFYDTSANSAWSFGRNYMSGNNGDVSKFDGPNPQFFLGDSNVPVAGHYDDSVDPAKAATGGSPWMDNFVHIVWGHVEELGYPIGPLRRQVARNLLHILKDPAYNPYLFQVYHMPVKALASNQPACSASGCAPGQQGGFFTNWSGVKGAFLPSTQNCADGTRYTYASLNFILGKPGCTMYPNYADHPYTGIARSAASYLPGISDTMSDGSTATGDQAWAWIDNVLKTDPNGFDSIYNENPKWALVPRSVTASSIPAAAPQPAVPSACDLNGDAKVDVADVRLAMDQALGVSACSSADLDKNGGCDVVDIQRVVNASTGQACRVGL